MISEMKYILLSMRPNQWVKNIFIFAGLIFSHNLLDVYLLLRVTAGFGLFCLAASSIYIFNDIKDLERDKEHPDKFKRPLAAGYLKVNKAYGASVVLGTVALLGAMLLDLTFFLILAGYVLMNLAYTMKIKEIVILDVFCIASGFVFRVLAGTLLANVKPSDWLIICTITISIFLGFSKRRHELTLFGANADNQRKVLAEYSINFLDQMISVATACTLMSYALYTISDETVARFGTKNLIFTIPFVIYGIYRYLYLIHQKKMGGNPTSALLADFPLFLNGLLWLVVIIIVIYY